MRYRRSQLHFILLLLAYYCPTHIAANGNGTTVQCLPGQASSLLQLKHSFHNPNLSSWQHGTDCCHWEGVGCDMASSQVITLDLSYRDLQSTRGLSPALFNLTSLRNLSLASQLSLLSQNSISGEVPEFLAAFSSLSTLDLSDNEFEGQFPTKIFHLKKLRSIDLSLNTRLFGHLPNFPVQNSLELLDLTDTNFTASIPDSFVNLKFLRSLALSMRELADGTIPLTFKLPSLQFLSLHGSGSEKPNFSWIGNLERLRYLDLEHYNLSSPITSWVGNLTSLTSLLLRDCSLYGRIPIWIGNLTNLSRLYLTSNNLQGEILNSWNISVNYYPLSLTGFISICAGDIPKCLFNHPKLGELNLGSNQLSGHLVDVSAPRSSPLYYIVLSYNQLSGHIPKSFFQLTKLEDILLESNKLEGAVELSLLSGLKYLELLSLSDNMLSVTDGEYPFPSLPNMQNLYLVSCNLAKIPSMLRHQYEMDDVDLSNNNIDGVIPCWLWENGENSIRFNLSHNMFTSLEKCTLLNPTMRSLGFLDLSSNRLEGNLPIPLISSTFGGVLLDYSNNSFSSITPAVDMHINNSIKLDLSKNKLNGDIPTSICGGNYEILDLSYNNLTGPIPACLIQHGNMKVLKMRKNQLHGILPENIGEGCMLQTIDLNSNLIEGKIPRSLSNCRSLEVFDIGNNHIVDSFPTWLGSISNLRVLILRSNQFYGSIGSLTKGVAARKIFSGMQIVDLDSNNFSGSLSSKWFDMLQTMMANSSGEGNALAFDSSFLGDQYYQEILTFKGIELTFTKILTTFKMIDFSNNAFDGPIPASVGKLIVLHGLNMSHNAFTGRIPSKLGDLAQLESLDLSQNKLSGVIPRDLTSLTYLAVLNLSYNSLTGMIPEGQQFSSFTNSSFQGNEGLCGRPLSKQCNSSVTGTLNSSVSSQDSVGTIVLFVFVGSGFGVGFAAAVVLSVVWQAKRWNCNCFPVPPVTMI
ncbi:hypothetical protein CFC21_040104 [Triticum aestivum]|uniref:Leucine-rich repeat-containing N-terminal plant-type domain-containing protein n=2 Tax=Triticum aestivum TaxID=4565 RepID=A0A9R1FGT1_WHEAT|nr:hypothetical protein CFC21_040104 [Triticum aestivum]